MKGNQHTKNHLDGRNLNVRLPLDVRIELDKQAARHDVVRADIVRDALQLYLPILAARQGKNGEA